MQRSSSRSGTPICRLTTQHQAMYDELHKRLQTALAAWQQVKSGELEAFNAQLKQTGVCPVAGGL